jgi:hypothetical protein
MPVSIGSLPTQLGRKRLLSGSFFVFAMLVAYEAGHYLLSGDLLQLGYAALLVVGSVFAMAVLKSWRKGLYLFLAWLLFEDLARKFLGNNMAIYFAKDALLLIVYIAFFIEYRRTAADSRVRLPSLPLAVSILIWFGVLQIFNPGSNSIFYGLLGFKLFFYYVPLFFVGYSLIASEADLRKFFHINLALMLAIIVLGVVQSILGPTFLNPAVPADDIRLLSQTYRSAPISGVRVYRPTSVFVSAGRFTDLLIVAWILVFGFSGYLLLRHRRGRSFAFLALSVTAVACVMCASRGAFMWSMGIALVGAAAFLWGAPWKVGEARQVMRTLNRAGLGVALGVVVLLATYPEAFLNRIAIYSETLDPRSPASELVHRTYDYPVRNFLAAFDYPRWPYGYGIGTVSLGVQYVSRIFGVKPAIGGVESGFGCLIIEMGIGGLILWLLMASAVLISAWRVVRQLKGSPWFPLAFMIFLYAFLLLLPLTYEGLQPYQDFILNAYLWLLLGILFRLPTLALSAQFASATENPHSAHRIP